METKTKKIYEIEATNDTTMIVQTVVPTTHGQKLAPEIAFALSDEVSSEWPISVVATISKAEAKELAKLLNDLVGEL